MKRLPLLFSSFGLALATSFFLVGTANAANAADFQAGRIIDDQVFYDSNSMSVSDIQNFLADILDGTANNGANVACDTQGNKPYYGTYGGVYHNGDVLRRNLDANYPPPYICLKDYYENPTTHENNLTKADKLVAPIPSGGISAAQIIYNAAQQYGISPKVLIVMIQKESSGPLLTDDWPWYPQYKTPMGYGCPDTAACDSTYFGFYNQVWNAARQYRVYANNPNSYNYAIGLNNIRYNPNAACGAKPVTIINQATASLYIYTPYTPNAAALANLYGTGDGCSAYGNRNFWRMYTDWFGSPTLSRLVRTANSPTYYILADDQKYGVPNGDILYAYGFGTTVPDVVSTSLLDSIPDGGTLGTLFTVPGDPTVYLADAGRHYGISSGAVCSNWGLACSNPVSIKVIDSTLFSKLQDGGVLGRIMINQGSYYLMDSGFKRPFLTQQSILDNGFAATDSSNIASWTNAIRAFGAALPQEGSFVQIAKSGTIFAYTQGKYYSIANFDTFKAWFTSASVVSIDKQSSYNDQPPVSSGNLAVVVNRSNGDHFFIDGGKKYSLAATGSDWPLGQDANNLSVFLDRLALTTNITADTTIREPDGSIYRIAGGTKQPFNSMQDYSDLGYNSKPLLNIASISLQIPLGNTAFADGSAYKLSGSGTIYYIGRNSKSYGVRSLQQLWAMHTNTSIPTISDVDSQQFAYQGPLSSLVLSNTSSAYIIIPSGRVSLSNNDLSNWGLTTSGSVVMSDISLSRVPAVNIIPMFFAAPNGTIFKGASGLAHPISSFSSYKSLGGNQTNTLVVTQDVIDSLTIGSPY